MSMKSYEQTRCASCDDQLPYIRLSFQMRLLLHLNRFRRLPNLLSSALLLDTLPFHSKRPNETHAS